MQKPVPSYKRGSLRLPEHVWKLLDLIVMHQQQKAMQDYQEGRSVDLPRISRTQVITEWAEHQAEELGLTLPPQDSPQN